MRLTAFEIQNYKVIDKIGPVEIDPNVTAFVGRNESGKTGVLRSLWKSSNVAGAKFNRLRDFPRSRYSKERKGTQRVTRAEFVLNEDEQAELAALLPSGMPQPKRVVLEVFYVGEDDTKTQYWLDPDIESAANADSSPVISAVAALKAALLKSSSDSVAVETAFEASDKIDKNAPRAGKETQSHIESILTAVDAVAGKTNIAQAEIAAVRALQSEQQSLDQARTWVKEHIPAFIYFDDYGQLETRIHLPTYIREVKSDPTNEKIRTQRALFQWSGLNPDEILRLGRPRDPATEKKPAETDDEVQERHDKRRALLESASFSLTGEWVDWWPEKRHQMHFGADGEYLVLLVSDEHNPFQIPFGERSHGFQWFFSFYLIFLVESEAAHQGAVLLLDEPGLHLHPTLQANLVSFFDQIADTNQVIYSTHLPFLVDGDRLDRVRAVYRSASDKSTVVSKELVTVTDADTLFPLQAAIGYSIAQTLFVSNKVVIVEGISDYWLLRTLNTIAAASGQPGLEAAVVLIPAGGTSRLMPLASIMFSKLGLTDGRKLGVLLDSDSPGKQAGNRLVSDLFRDKSRVAFIGDAWSATDATIEDIMPRDEYVAAVNAALNLGLVLDATEQKLPTNVGAVKQAMQRVGAGDFAVEKKAEVALRIANHWSDKPAAATEALKKAVPLFALLNGLFK